MARVLLAWELGGGIGHLVRLLPVAAALVKRGHRVFAAVKDLLRAQAVLGQETVSYLQAPTRARPVANHIERPLNFAHILHNIGFDDPGELRVMSEAWRNLYALVEPDLVVFDHSPTALLAARGLEIKRIVVGSGFFCPPDAHPLPNLRPWLTVDADRLRADEERIFGRMNRLLAGWGQDPLERILQLYSQVDETILTTFSELDHYPQRRGARYWGAWTRLAGKQPQWPDGQGKKVYAYLKQFPGLVPLLKLLKESGHPTIIYMSSVPGELREALKSPTLRSETEPLNLDAVGRQCDLAILNGGHGTTISMLMAGKPTMQIPIYLEQVILTNRVVEFGAGLGATNNRPEYFPGTFRKLLDWDRYSQAARQFASRYADFDPEQQTNRIVDRMEEILRR